MIPLAYGPTGSSRTYSMFGENGIVAEAFQVIRRDGVTVGGSLQLR